MLIINADLCWRRIFKLPLTSCHQCRSPTLRAQFANAMLDLLDLSQIPVDLLEDAEYFLMLVQEGLRHPDDISVEVMRSRQAVRFSTHVINSYSTSCDKAEPVTSYVGGPDEGGATDLRDASKTMCQVDHSVGAGQGGLHMQLVKSGPVAVPKCWSSTDAFPVQVLAAVLSGFTQEQQVLARQFWGINGACDPQQKVSAGCGWALA